MFEGGMRTTLAQRLVSIVSSVFDLTCFNRLAAHFNIRTFGHQTMFDGVSSPNISHLSRPFHVLIDCSVARLYIANEEKAKKERARELKKFIMSLFWGKRMQTNQFACNLL